METRSHEYLNGRLAAMRDIYRRKTFPNYCSTEFVKGYNDYWDNKF